jgi:hypothetical protein
LSEPFAEAGTFADAGSPDEDVGSESALEGLGGFVPEAGESEAGEGDLLGDGVGGARAVTPDELIDDALSVERQETGAFEDGTDAPGAGVFGGGLGMGGDGRYGRYGT